MVGRHAVARKQNDREKAMTEQPIAGDQIAKVLHSPHIDIPEGVKQAAAATIYQAREGYEKLYSNAEAMTDAVELSYSMAVTDATDLGGKIMYMVETNISASFDFMASLMAARSLPEAITLSTKFTQRQLETFAKQAKDFWSFGQKMMADTTKPVASGFSRLDRAVSS